MRSLLIVFLFFAITGCDPFDARLVLLNTTNKTLFVHVGCDEIDNLSYHRSLSSYSLQYYNYLDSLPAYSSIYIRRTGPWDSFIRDSCHNSTIKIFIYTQDTLIKYNWEYIVSNKKYSKIQLATLKTILLNNWTIKI